MPSYFSSKQLKYERQSGSSVTNPDFLFFQTNTIFLNGGAEICATSARYYHLCPRYSPGGVLFGRIPGVWSGATSRIPGVWSGATSRIPAVWSGATSGQSPPGSPFPVSVKRRRLWAAWKGRPWCLGTGIGVGWWWLFQYLPWDGITALGKGR